MTAAAEILAAVTAAADRGAPLGPRDLLRFEAVAVRTLFESGDIWKAEMPAGRALAVAILPAAVPDADDSAWSDDELQYLETAYTGGVSFETMSRALKRPGGEILQTAWRHKWRRAAIDAEGWGNEIPAWRIARLRRALDEAELRGETDDDGEGLGGHRALLRRYAKGRANRAARGRHCHRWTAAETRELEARWDAGETHARIARALRRTLSAISSKLSEMDMARCVNWTVDEDRVVVAGVGRGLTTETISTMLPGRSRIAVKVRARQLCGPRGAELWSEAEKAALREAVAAGANLRRFARDIGRGVCGVRWQCRALGLSHPAAVVPYTPAEDHRIAEGYRRREHPAEIAADLGRPLAGVYNRAFKLGLTKGLTSQRRPWKRYELEYIRVRAAQGWTGRQIAARLPRRNLAAIYRAANKHGIRWEMRGPRSGGGPAAATGRGIEDAAPAPGASPAAGAGLAGPLS